MKTASLSQRLSNSALLLHPMCSAVPENRYPPARKPCGAMPVGRLLMKKGTNRPHILPGTFITDVIELLEFGDIGAITVSRDGIKVEGIISERDIVRGLRYYGAEILERTVDELMTVEVHTCTPQCSVASVLALMRRKHIRHVPVVDKGKLTGIVDLRDVVSLGIKNVQPDAEANDNLIEYA